MCVCVSLCVCVCVSVCVCLWSVCLSVCLSLCVSRDTVEQLFEVALIVSSIAILRQFGCRLRNDNVFESTENYHE